MDDHGEVPDAFVADCPSREIFARIAEKWTLLIVVALANGPVRFGVLKRRIGGISQKMLSQTLQKLEGDGLIVRTLIDERPLKVEYHLTDEGRQLLELVEPLKSWAERKCALDQAAVSSCKTP